MKNTNEMKGKNHKKNTGLIYAIIMVVLVVIIAVTILLVNKNRSTASANMAVLEKYSWNDGIHERTLTLGEKDRFEYREKAADGSSDHQYFGTYTKENEEIKVTIESSTVTNAPLQQLPFKKEGETVVYTDPEGNTYVFSKITNDNQIETPPVVNTTTNPSDQ